MPSPFYESKTEIVVSSPDLSFFFFFYNDTGLFHIATVAWEHRELETKSKEAKLTYTRRIYKNNKTSVQFQRQNVNSSRIIRKDLSAKFISQLGKFYETQRYAG